MRGLLIVLLLAMAASPCGAQQILLRAADSYPVEYPTTAALQEIKRYLEEKSDGRIQMILYANAELGSERETLEMTQIGALDIARVSVLELAKLSPGMEVLNLPYLFRNKYHLWSVLQVEEFGRHFLSELASKQLIGLCFYEAGSRGFYTIDHPVRRPEDLRQLKIGIPHSDITRDIVQSLEAVPTRMNLDEIYGALELGVIDGGTESLPAYFARGHYRKARHYTMIEYSHVPHVVVMNPITWNKLSAQDQYLIQRAADESTRYQREQWDQLEQEALRTLRKEGVEVIQVSKDVKDLFVKAMEPVRKKYRKRTLELMIQVIPDEGLGE